MKPYDVHGTSYQLIMVTNYFNPHTIGLASSFYDQLGYRFLALETKQVDDYRRAIGWSAESHPFIKPYDKHLQDVLDCHVLMLSGVLIDATVAKRLKRKGLTFLAMERPYKISTSRANWVKRQLAAYWRFRRFRSQKFYLLTMGGYVKDDFYTIDAFDQSHILKWGYFPQLRHLDGQTRSFKQPLRMVWCGRMVEWKHPQRAIDLAQLFHDHGIELTLDIYGDGPEKHNLVVDSSLQDYIKIHDFLENDSMQRVYTTTDIVLMTSDRYEGWGAVVNEAMGHGCVIIANRMVGSVKAMVKDRINGLVYANYKDCVGMVDVLQDSSRLQQISLNAVNTIQNLWNYENAASRFINFSSRCSSDNSIEFDDGPLSIDTYEVNQ